MIAVVDYGLNNLHSVRQAVSELGTTVKVSADAETLKEAQGIILPGVGAFGDAMDELHSRGLAEALVEETKAGKPLLGICLGMQLLFEESEEHGLHCGLGLLPGRVVRFQGRYKIPHMGWNELKQVRPHPLLDGLKLGYVYFVHSYYVISAKSEILLATTDYYQSVPAIVGEDHVYGMQFHPEKSGRVGMALLQRFLRLCEAKSGEEIGVDG